MRHPGAVAPTPAHSSTAVRRPWATAIAHRGEQISVRLEESADLQDHQMAAEHARSGIVPFRPAPERDTVTGRDRRSPSDREASEVELGLG